MKEWRKVKSKIVYKNPWFSVCEDRVERPDGRPGIYGVVKKISGCRIIGEIIGEISTRRQNGNEGIKEVVWIRNSKVGKMIRKNLLDDGISLAALSLHFSSREQ